MKPGRPLLVPLFQQLQVPQAADEANMHIGKRRIRTCHYVWIVAGNLARHIRYRFAPDIIDELLRLQWWNWSEERLRSEATYLTRIHSKPA